MKYLKKYNESQDQQDPEFSITKIKEDNNRINCELKSKIKVESLLNIISL